MSYDSKAGQYQRPTDSPGALDAISGALGDMVGELHNAYPTLLDRNAIAMETKNLEQQGKLPCCELAACAAATDRTRQFDPEAVRQADERFNDAVASGNGMRNLDIQDYNPEPADKAYSA